MRIAYVCTDPGVPVFGRKGASVHVREVVAALRRRGVEVTIFATRLEGDPPAALAGVPTVALPTADSAGGADREAAALAANAATARAIRAAGPFDSVYERHALWSFAGMELAADLGLPSVLEVNAPLVEEQARYRGLVRVEEAREAARRSFAAAGAVAAVSDGVAAYVRGVAPSAEIHVVPNGVDTDRFHPRNLPTRRQSAGPAVGFVGTLKPWHGVETLLEAAAAARRSAPGLRVLIVGDGPERNRLEAHARSIGLGGVAEFTGPVDPDDVPGLVASMDIAAAPYPALAGFYFSPLKLYEYMAAGRAIVASRIGQIESVLREGETGLMCPPGEATALAGAIAQLANDPGRRTRLGAAARAAAEAHHTWDAVARTIVGLLGRRSGAGHHPRLAESTR